MHLASLIPDMSLSCTATQMFETPKTHKSCNTNFIESKLEAHTLGDTIQDKVLIAKGLAIRVRVTISAYCKPPNNPGACIHVIQRQTNLFATQSGFDLLALALAKRGDLFLGSVDCRMDLVEWVLLAFLELLPAKIHALIPAKTRGFLFYFWQPPLLECSIRSLESSLGVSVNLRGILRG
jgi:hypothetical protein